jgi:nucleotide-binding universal stress UspA family protein
LKFQSIVVPVDGSSFAERAVWYASAVARSGEARLTILQVVPSAGPNATNEAVAQQADEIVQAQAYVEELADRLASGVNAEGAVTVGDAASEILEEARDRRADLIVMSTHGRSGIGRWVYGSVADEVMRHAEIPLMLIPAHARSDWPTHRPPHILVPLDGSDLALGALGCADQLVETLGGELLLVQAVEVHPPMYGDPSNYVVVDPTPELEGAKARLDRAASVLRAKGRRIEVAELLGFAVSAIVDAARERGVDLIAMSTHGSGGLTRLIMGSVATGIVQRADIPVVVLRPHPH